MATIFIPIPISDSSVTDGTNPAKAGLTPTVLAGINIATNAAITSGNYPTITAGPTSGASGFYTASYDPEANGEAVFQVDAGAGLSKNVDRFFYLIFTRDSSRVLAGFNASGQITGYAGNTPQTGDNFGLLNPMIASHVFTAPALVNAPSAAVAVGVGSVAAVTSNAQFTAVGAGLPKSLDLTTRQNLLFQTGANAGWKGPVSAYTPGSTASITLADAPPNSVLAGDTFVIG